ncbi:MAG: FHA domain-containing protein [Pirellulales bacterium]|nr:FHA domain-containing protein [Pirellulales bacterium]
MDARLVVVEGKATRKVVQLKLPTTIGRSREADLKVGHASVSRIHCEIYELDGALVVRDAGSLNGTFIDNVRITESILKPGDRLTVGPLTFVAEYEHQGDFPVLPVRAAPSATTTVPDDALKRIASASASSTSPGFSPPPVPIPLGTAVPAPLPHNLPLAAEETAESASPAPPVEAAGGDASPQAPSPHQGGNASAANVPATIDLPPTLDMPAEPGAVAPPTPDVPPASAQLPFLPPGTDQGVQQVDEDDDDLQNFFQELGLK